MYFKLKEIKQYWDANQRGNSGYQIAMWKPRYSKYNAMKNARLSWEVLATFVEGMEMNNNKKTLDSAISHQTVTLQSSGRHPLEIKQPLIIQSPQKTMAVSP